MAVYIGHIVTLDLRNEGGKFCGRLISHDHTNGKIVLSKVTCLTTGKKLPGNQIYFDDEIVPDSLNITDEVKNECIKIDNKCLKEQARSMEGRGFKRDNPLLPVNADLQKETFELGAFFKYIQTTDDPSQLPSNLVTANVYKERHELIPREQWKKLMNNGARPTQFIVIDKLGELFDEAIFRIESEKSVGVAFTGADISRRGKLCWIQIATADMVYLFDSCTMGHSCISYGLDRVFSSSTILKVIHDCRCISDLLFHQYNVKIVNIFDTQVAAVLLFRATHGGDLPAYVRSLQTLVEEYLPIEQEEFHVLKVRQAFKDADEQMWSTRPMHNFLLDSLAKTVSYLNELREPLLRGILSDFYIAIDAYVSVMRDLTDQDFDNNSQPERHHLPTVFTKLQRRDEARRQSVRKRNQANFVTEDGFVETCDNPRDIYYKRDSIMHSRFRKPCTVKAAPATSRKASANKYVVPSYLQSELPPSAADSAADRPKHAVTAVSTKSQPAQQNPDVRAFSTSSPSRSSPSKSSPSKSSPSKPSNAFIAQSDQSSLSSATQPWQPIPEPKTEPTPFVDMGTMDGVADSVASRPVCVGRGRPHAISSLPKQRSPGAVNQAVSLAAASGDSDSGLDSGTIQRSHPIHSVGVTAGFQNLELMGVAPISLDNVPEGFDLRSASLSELKQLRERALWSNNVKPKIEKPKPLGVRRHLLKADGSIKDLDSGLEITPIIDTSKASCRTGVEVKTASRLTERSDVSRVKTPPASCKDVRIVESESDSDIEWD